MNAYARAKDGRVRQVSASLSGEWQRIEILRAGGEHYSDIRPLVRLNVSVVVEDNGRQESGSFGGGGRSGYETYLDADYWQAGVDEALRQALVNLTSVPAPAGEMTVVLGPGLAGHPVARSHRARAGRRFQPQGHLGIRRAAGRTGRRAGRHRGG